VTRLALCPYLSLQIVHALDGTQASPAGFLRRYLLGKKEQRGELLGVLVSSCTCVPAVEPFDSLSLDLSLLARTA
jgi:hypothetical protein